MAKLFGYFAVKFIGGSMCEAIGFTVDEGYDRKGLEERFHEAGWQFEVLLSDKPFKYENTSNLVYAFSEFVDELESKGISVEVEF